MRKLYLATLLLLSTTAVFAADGDTTTVVAQSAIQMDHYGDFDQPVIFPSGTTTYRNITMEFELGKYACPGYNPNNPGEDTTQTGWCADWDYDVHVILCTPDGDTVEIGRLITPYANSNFPRTPLTWKHAYLYDVSDYYPLLKDSATIRIMYSGYSWGFTGTVKFHFTEGTPVREVLAVKPLWQGNFSYGNATNAIDTALHTQTLTVPAGTVAADMKLIITGHGGDNTENCAEFCKKWYKFKVNDTMVDQTDIWRDDCGSNFLYPQSGTWVYDRGNWCPGDLVRVNNHTVPSAALSSSTFTTRLDFQPYVSGNNNASYKIAGTMFFYGDFNHTVDLGIDEVISPNKEETYYRSNPICGEPRIKVKNYGSDTVTAVEFEYGVEGQTMSTYTWTNNLAPLAIAEVTLPSIPSLNTATGINEFVVKIVKVNGSADDELFNNEMTTTFKSAPKWQGGNFYVNLKMTGGIQGYVNKVNWTISDMAGNVLFNRNGTANSTNYLDTVHLENGCYKLDVDAAYIGYGMNFFNQFAKGYVRVYDLATGSKIALPKTDLGNPGLEANFGNGFTQYFSVTNSIPAGIDQNKMNQYNLIIFPNPAKDVINIEVVGELGKNATIVLSNIIGQEVYSITTNSKKIEIPVASLASGIYTLTFQNNGNKKVEKIVIER